MSYKYSYYHCNSEYYDQQGGERNKRFFIASHPKTEKKKKKRKSKMVWGRNKKFWSNYSPVYLPRSSDQVPRSKPSR